MKRMRVLWILGLFAAAFAGCTHKDLCYDHPHTGRLRVVFDWRNDPQARPESMYAWFFPVQGGAPVQFEFPGYQGGVVELAEGDYSVLCLNGDTHNILYRNTDDRNTLEVYTGEQGVVASLSRASDNAPRADGTENQPSVAAPEMLWGDRLSQVRVVKNTEQVITLYPSSEVCAYTVEVRDVENLSSVSQLAGSLSGMAGALLPYPNVVTGGPCIIPYAMEKQDGTTIVGRFLTFGHCPQESIKHKVVIYAVMDNGGQQYAIFGDKDDVVTPQVHQAPDPRNVHIILEGIKFTPTTSGGMSPSIDDWGEVHIDINM